MARGKRRLCGPGSDVLHSVQGERTGKIVRSTKDKVSDTVTQYLLSNAHSTFLWVASVCEELAKAKPWNTRQQLRKLPAGLSPLYELMISRLLQVKDTRLYQRLLGDCLAVYRQITVDELPGLVKMPNIDE